MTTPAATLTIKVDGIDLTPYIDVESVQIMVSVSQRMSTCNFTLTTDPSVILNVLSKHQLTISGAVSTAQGGMLGPWLVQNARTTWFGGEVAQIVKRSDNKVRIWDVYGQGYASYLDTTAVNKVYNNMTDVAIIQDLLVSYDTGLELTSSAELTDVAHIAFPYMTLRDCLNTICNYAGTIYWVDGDKTLHYIDPLTQNAVPVTTFSNAPDNVTSFGYEKWKATEDATQLQNRVVIVGGQFQGQALTDTFTANGTQTAFMLSKQPLQVTSCTVGGSAAQTGQSGIDKYGDTINGNTITALVDSQGQTLTLQTTPVGGTVVDVTYTYTLPALARVHDSESQTIYGRWYDSIVPDSSLISLQSVLDRGRNILDQYAFPILNGALVTRYQRVEAGDLVKIVNTTDGIDGTYLVTDVQYSFLGNGVMVSQVTFVGDVFVASPGQANGALMMGVWLSS